MEGTCGHVDGAWLSCAYKDVWEAAVGDELHCEREPENRQDSFVVAVVRSAVTVGHIPKRI